MTKYIYDLSLGDSSMIALKAALEMYEKYCSEQLANGQRSPYLMHHESIKHIQSRLLSNKRQISGNNFGGNNPGEVHEIQEVT